MLGRIVFSEKEQSEQYGMRTNERYRYPMPPDSAESDTGMFDTPVPSKAFPSCIPNPGLQVVT
jgi:hypothetical protein